jgi:hypothetical protein
MKRHGNALMQQSWIATIYQLHWCNGCLIETFRQVIQQNVDIDARLLFKEIRFLFIFWISDHALAA